MKTLILYATKHGGAAEIGRRIAAKFDDVTLHDLKQPTADLSSYDCIIVGSSVYAGAFRKEAKLFLSQNGNILKSKKLGLFVCAMSKGESDKIFADNISADVLAVAKVTALLGGLFDPKKANFAERLIMRLVTKQSGYVDTIDNDKIEKFVETLQA